MINNPIDIKLFKNAIRLNRQLAAYKNYDNSEVVSNLESAKDMKINYNENQMDMSFQEQLYLKRDLIVQAERCACLDQDKLLIELGEKEFSVLMPFNYIISNPFDYDLKSVAYMHLNFWEMKIILLHNFIIVDEEGNELKCQIMPTIRGFNIVADVNLKAKECKKLTLVKKSRFNPKVILTASSTILHYAKSAMVSKNMFSNKHYSAKRKRNNISVFNKQDKNFKFINNIVPIVQVEDKTIVGRYKSMSVKCVGNVFNSYTVNYEFANSSVKSCKMNYVFYHKSEKIDFSCDLVKDNCNVKEKISILIESKFANIDDRKFSDVETGIILNCDNSSLVINFHDTISASIESEKLYLNLVENHVENMIVDHNAVMFNARFSMQTVDCLSAEKLLQFNDIDIITVRSGVNEKC